MDSSRITSPNVKQAVPFLMVSNIEDFAMWVTSVTDPDGYRVEFESSTDVPEETVLDRA